MTPTALIAEDEPLLAQALRAELAAVWPALQIVATVGDGLSAVRQAVQHLPQVLFLDIRMPGLDGLAAAAEIADQWPTDEAPLPQLVFVTAYDEYAARAFDAQALDYVLKPVQGDRLRRTVARLQQTLAQFDGGASAPAAFSAASAPATSAATSAQPISLGLPTGTPPDGDALAATLAQWRQLLAAAGELPSQSGLNNQSGQSSHSGPLKFIAASETGSSGATVRMVPIDEVVYFEAADKYVRVLTASHEYLIRTPLKQLIPQLDANRFWQVHRAIVVRSDDIESVHRDEAGKQHLTLRGRGERIPVSRLYAHLFRAM
ncbi:MAG: LytTR family DNA-binding domain-containing protein [Pseudomonadota bacterium]